MWYEITGFESLKDLEDGLTVIEGVLDKLKNGGRKGKTVGGYKEALSTFSSWCVSRKYLSIRALQIASATSSTSC